MYRGGFHTEESRNVLGSSPTWLGCVCDAPVPVWVLFHNLKCLQVLNVDVSQWVYCSILKKTLTSSTWSYWKSNFAGPEDFFLICHETKWLRPKINFSTFLGSDVIFKPAFLLHRWKWIIFIDFLNDVLQPQQCFWAKPSRIIITDVPFTKQMSCNTEQMFLQSKLNKSQKNGRVLR